MCRIPVFLFPTQRLRNAAHLKMAKKEIKQGRHLACRKQGAARSLSANPDRRFKSGSRKQKEKSRRRIFAFCGGSFDFG